MLNVLLKHVSASSASQRRSPGGWIRTSQADHANAAVPAVMTAAKYIRAVNDSGIGDGGGPGGTRGAASTGGVPGNVTFRHLSVQ